MSKWSDYYKTRNCASYRDYFKEKYKEFFYELEKCNGILMEAGCGISTVSKILRSFGKNCCGFDLDDEMLEIGKDVTWEGDILDRSSYSFFDKSDLIIHSHGVLEHFLDKEVNHILGIQKEIANKIIHWVPTNKYEKPSFGDERLLPVEYWVDKFKPSEVKWCDKGVILIWK